MEEKIILKKPTHDEIMAALAYLCSFCRDEIYKPGICDPCRLFRDNFVKEKECSNT